MKANNVYWCDIYWHCNDFELASMTEFVGECVSSEETFMLCRIPGVFRLFQGCPEVSHTVMATTTVELLSDSNPRLKIAGILSHHDRVPGGQQSTGAPTHIVYAHKANRELRWSATDVGCALQQQRDVSIPNNVVELCPDCFKGCESLRRVTFGSSSALERIGVECFAYSGVEDVCIPNSVRELCDCCFKWCKSLRRVTSGASSALERIGDSCFAGSGIEEVSIPDSVRELCDRCFQSCSSLRRVTSGASSSLERIGISCFAFSGVEDVRLPDRVRMLCNRCFSWCKRLLNPLFRE